MGHRIKDEDYVRAPVDFLGRPYVEASCPRCKSKYLRMEIDSKGKICPSCDNSWWEEEVDED